MRLIILFGLFFMLIALPAKLDAQSTRVTLNMVNVPLNDVLNEIEKKSEYSFLVNQEFVDVTRKVDAVFVKTSVKDVLDYLFRGEKINYVTSKYQIIITPKNNNPEEGTFQPKKITGKVTDGKSQ